MKLHITPQQFEELIKRSYNLDIIYLLKLIEEQYDISPLYKDSMKVASLYQSLIRKGLITDTDEKLTVLGKDLLEFVGAQGGKKIIKRKPATTDFEEWYKSYPGTDSFEYKGKTFKGTRAIRKGKDECRLKFDKILLEGDYTAEQLIAALKYEVLQKKESSLETNTNKITFMQNSVTYLNQRSFEAYIELINEGNQVEVAPDKPEGGTDI
jgi:hypothetical protein